MRMYVICGIALLGVVGGTLLALTLSDSHDHKAHPLIRFLGLSNCRCSPERTADMSLRTVFTAQRDFRGHDRDGNGKSDYWRADIAGLYCLRGPGDVPVKLIELSIAGADDGGNGQMHEEAGRGRV